MRLLGVLLGCLFVLSASRSDALAECDFTFDVSRESSALQSLIEGAQDRGGFWRPIREAPDDVRDIGRFIGRLDICLVTPDGKPRTIRIGGNSQELASPYVTTCTAALLPDNRLLANRHCFYEPLLIQAGFTFVQEARINFGYVSEDFTDDVKTFLVSTREVAQDEATDALVLQVVGADANETIGGHIPMIMETRATPRRALTMVHHPLRQPQRFSSGTCQIHPTQAELPDGVAKLRHTCETGGGSSGALLLDARTLAVVGLHNRGGLSARGGHNGGHKIAAVEAALSLGFREESRSTPKQDPEADAQVALILALAMETATAKAEALKTVETRFPGTRAANVARRELGDLREDLGAAQLDEAQAVVDPVRRLQAVEAIGREFPGTRAARQAERLLALMTPVVDPERQAQAALSDALGLTGSDARKAALEQVVVRFPDSSSAVSARVALGLFAPKPVSPEAQATEALTRALQLDGDARRSALQEIGSAFSGTAAAGSAEAMLALMQPAPAQPATDNLPVAADPPPPRSALGDQAEVLGMEMSTLTPGLRRHYGFSDKDKGVVVVGVKSGRIASENGIVAGALITGAGWVNVDHPEQVVAVEDNTRRQGRKTMPIYFTLEGKKNVVTLPLGQEDARKRVATLATSVTKAKPVTFPPPPRSALGEQAEVLGMEMSTLTPGLRRHYGLSDKDKGVVVVGVKSGSIASENGIVAGALITGASYSNVDHPEQVVWEEDNLRRQRRQALPIYFTFEGKKNVVRLPMKR